ncbi:OspD family protein [Borrelia sp. RT1S]|uniref:OspD family protein n=1 Tax=Borrelia sp. RT1S TaxID=2898580 RepID=UPI001E31E80E|nr:OspD family protein [Borrelia sp. RT1S]UGQ17626.1 OspD family protein [Borrelia sp. RT1S]
MERLMKILILSLLSLIVISCTHEEQGAPEDGENKQEKENLKNHVLTEKDILGDLNQALSETETLLETAKLTKENLNASNEDTIGNTVVSAINLISSAADKLKSASEKVHDLSKSEGVNVEDVKGARDKVTSAAVAAKEAVDLAEKEKQNIQIAYKAQMEEPKPASETEEVKKAKVAVAEVSQAMDKAGNDLVEAVKVVKEALDKSKIEAITNTESKIGEVVGLVIKIAEKTEEIVQEVLNPLNAT